MTNIYVGFHDQRSCNRILKPPGGGTSNIFGTDAVPDVVSQVSPRKGNQHTSTIQNVIQTETVTSVIRNGEKSSNTNGGLTVEHKICKLEANGNGETNGGTNLQEVALITEEANGYSEPDVVEVTGKMEHVRIEERSSKTEISETDSSGNTKVISSNSNSEGSVEKNSNNYKRGTSIEEVLKQDIEEKKKVRGQVQRVPPGGYSSGLW